MTKYKRNWDCAVCGGEVIYDMEKGVLTCLCGDRKFQPRPIDRFYFKKVEEEKLDAHNRVHRV